MILVIDNYDSFTFNIVQYLGALGQTLEVWRNDTFNMTDIEKLSPQAIILSPGPGHPEDAGYTCDVIRRCMKKYPILGVCLGHQAIGLVEGGQVGQAHQQLHGKRSKINLRESELFESLPQTIDVVRYHSLVIKKNSCPNTLKVISTDDKGEIMAVEHKEYPLFGVQFHPESYGTQGGITIFENFLKIAKTHNKEKKI
tara:strand:- start:778 stop:1371 length:594 start_codon:yes stop_codon:yes gene_type:complete